MSRSDPPAQVSAAVLAGGKSSRMGTDKALVPVVPGGPVMLDLVLARLRSISDDLYIVASERPAYGVFGIPVMPDSYPDAGVLGGIASALRYARHERCLVVGCDMPLLNLELLRLMLTLDDTVEAVVPRTLVHSRQGGLVTYQPLHAVYHRRCLAAIERALQDQKRQAVAFLPDVHVRFIDEPLLRAIDPELRSLTSIDTQERLVEVRQWLANAGQDESKVRVEQGRR